MPSMLPDKSVGNTQARILQVLLQSDGPLPVENLTRHLDISRNATYQHVVALERDGLIEKSVVTQTKGRPSQTYQLTDKGRATFPKHYSLFAKLLIGIVKSRLSGDQLRNCLVELGQSLAGKFTERVSGLNDDDLIVEVAKIMREIGYESEATLRNDGGGFEIRAHNCVFHDLAVEHEEVCTLDIALISRLTGKPIEHTECVVRGGTCCRFRTSNK